MPDRDAMIEAAADALIAQGHYYGSWEDQRNAAVPNAAAVLDVVRPLILREAQECLVEVSRGWGAPTIHREAWKAGLADGVLALGRLADGNTTTANDSAGGEST